MHSYHAIPIHDIRCRSGRTAQPPAKCHIVQAIGVEIPDAIAPQQLISRVGVQVSLLQFQPRLCDHGENVHQRHQPVYNASATDSPRWNCIIQTAGLEL